MTDPPWPTDIHYVRHEKVLHVTFDSGERFALAAEFLRVESPSAEVRGHGGSATRQLVRGKQDVEILRIEPVGNYAVRLVFSDGHDSGLYSWALLYEFGRNQASLVAHYRAALARAEADPRGIS